MKSIGPLVCAALVVSACQKVPLVDINARFILADAAWFEEEETLFIFYNVTAEQGLGPESQLEVTWRTDDAELPWTSTANLPPVHTHLSVLCGPNTMCGSTSLKVPKLPVVGLRLRYHRNGAQTLVAPVTFNHIGKGPAHSHRSLVVYGVFEEKNETVQWRARHQFPTLRNQEVEEKGLRRRFRIAEPRYGDVVALPANSYGYGLASNCPAAMTPLPWAPLETLRRAVFDTNKLPLAASTALAVCAQSVVTDAKGQFETVAIARKNPDVRAAFPSLRSPIRSNTELGFVMRPCRREISNGHLSMQVQRLLLSGAPEICIDDFKDPTFPNTLAARLRTAIEAERAKGKDMVLALAVHHDDTKNELGAAIEKALELILPFERNKSSPRVSGAFVFDSAKYKIVSPALRALVLWCPASIDEPDLDKIPDTSSFECPLVPLQDDLKLGPFRFNSLPILPSRAQYLTFIAKYSESQTGQVTKLTFLAPERTPTSQNTQIGDFGVATFFNNETFSAAPTDAFSFCPSADPETQRRLQAMIARGQLAPIPFPISTLPDVHERAPATSYEVGLFWDFPFLLQMDYTATVGAAATAFSVTVPFGISTQASKPYANELWKSGEFALGTSLLQCTRFCDHPTFKGQVYEVAAPFRQTYKSGCYTPIFPVPTDGDFPLDP